MKNILVYLAVCSGVAFVLCAMLVTMFRFYHKSQPITYGVSFSVAQAESLKIDWRKAFESTLSDLKVKNLRLMSYWDQGEPQPGNYKFEDLDWQFSKANEYGAKVSLAIGVRQPRWPECHEPSWAKEQDDKSWQASLETYISEVVSRYKNNPALQSWQLENEYYNKDFGKQCRNFDRLRLDSEFNLVKSLDREHSIIMNQSNQVGIPVSKPHPDIYGFSIYRRVFDSRVLSRYITHPVPAWLHSLRAMIIQNIWHKPVIIHELQAEPWATQPLIDVSAEESSKTMNIIQLERNLEYAKQTGIKSQYLWGVEWWYWQKQEGDSSYWDHIKNAVANTKYNR